MPALTSGASLCADPLRCACVLADVGYLKFTRSDVNPF